MVGRGPGHRRADLPAPHAGTGARPVALRLRVPRAALDPTELSCRSRWSGARTPRSTARRRRCSTATAPTSTPSSPSGTPLCRACWIAASCSRTCTSEAAASVVAAGGWTAAWRTSRTPSPTTSRRPTAWTGRVDGSRLATRGLSAGGLLQGVVFSQRPDRWRAVVAEVPFVDVVTTMFDAEHPADGDRVGRVGRPASPRGVRLDARVLALRQPPARGLTTGPAGHRRAARPPGDGLRAGQVGGRAASQRPGVVAALPVPLRDRRGCARRPVGPLRPPGLRGRDLRLGAGSSWSCY